ncbi:hypothetical protein CRYUN_Cryun32bG0112300 [Craigia yunnanensis]
MMMRDDVENGNLGPYQDRPRTFPNMRSKPYTPLRVKSASAMMMRDDVENGNLGPYQDRLRTFPNMRSKPHTPLNFRILMGINVRVLVILLLLGFGYVFYVGASTSPIIVFVFSVCIICFLLSIYLTKWVLSKDEGPPEMIQISKAIRDGAEGFFRTQYGVAGYIGMWVSVRANVRVLSAARRSAREALQIAVRAGGFSALVVVGMAVIGIAILYATFYVWLGVDSPGSMKVTDGIIIDTGDSLVDFLYFLSVPLLLVGYGFGASFVALFSQLGGGIYTKAADVGADLVGKVEQGIPEDDPRNPAVIADLVGDNVGDCAARGADLFESIAAEIISAMILGGTMVQRCKIEGNCSIQTNLVKKKVCRSLHPYGVRTKFVGCDNPSGFIMFPLVVHSFDLVVSSIGILSIRSICDSSVKAPIEDPMAILQKGYSVTIVLAVLTFAGSTRWLLYTEQAPSAWLIFALCGLVGIITAYVFVWITKYYTDYKHEPVRTLALSSSTGHGTNIIAGVSLGLESTAFPVLVISISIISAFWLGHTSGLVDETGNPTGGLFGSAVATMGMLSTVAYILTMDMFGPIADNAGGIVEMSQQPESVREITDILDAVGNTTKATTKGFAIGSAALASFLLFSAYMDEVASFAGESFKQDYKEKPDYGRCVAIVASASLREMIKPGALAIVSPIVVDILLAAIVSRTMSRMFCIRVLGHYTGHPLLGAKVVAAMLMFATVSGILMALFLNTAGGAWDNAKKLIETGALGGKGSDSHKAAVTGDTVDPFKDTAHKNACYNHACYGASVSVKSLSLNVF